jgi:hypothetical protein
MGNDVSRKVQDANVPDSSQNNSIEQKNSYGAIFSGKSDTPLYTFDVPWVLPDAVDLRTENASPYPEPWDQGKTSSCTAFAAAAALLCTSRKDHRFPLWNPSPVFLYYYLAKKSSPGTPGRLNPSMEDSGASLADAMAQLQKGVAPLEDWSFAEPFNRTPLTWVQDNARKFRANPGHCVFLQQSLDQFKTALAIGVSIALSFVVSDEGDLWMRSPDKQRESNFLYPASWGEQDLPRVKSAHSVLLVGYDSLPRHFIVRNSWGPTWGTGGHFYLGFDTVTKPFWCRDFCCVLATAENS